MKWKQGNWVDQNSWYGYLPSGRLGGHIEKTALGWKAVTVSPSMATNTYWETKEHAQGHVEGALRQEGIFT